MSMTKLRGSQLSFSVRNIFCPKNRTDDAKVRETDFANRGTPLECQKRSRFVQLPEDILLLFSHHLDKAAKANVIQTCRYLRHSLEATLYIHLGPLEFWYSHRVDLLHRTLVERPDLITYIRSYRGSFMATPPLYTRPPPQRTLLDRLRRRKTVERLNSPASNSPITESEAFRNAAFIFSKAINIADLDFSDHADWLSDPIFEPIKTAVFNMALTRLYLWNCVVPAQILWAQPHLEHLEVGWNVHGLDGLENGDIPKLTALTANLKDASYIVPGRPVKQLELVARYEESDFDPVLFQSLALSTGPIVKLTVCMYRLWDDENAKRTLQITSQNLPHLEQLVITVAGSIPEKVILEEIPSFESLRRLAFLNANLVKATELPHSSPDGSADLPTANEIAQHDITTNLIGSRLPSFLLNVFPLKHPANELRTPECKSPDRGTPLGHQKNSKFAQLPQEIILLIVDHLGSIGGASLIRTCRYFHILLEWTLYRHISLTRYPKGCKSSYLHRTLGERPDLISFIRTYHGPVLPRIVAPEPQVAQWKFFKTYSKSKKSRSNYLHHTPSTKMDALKHAASMYTQATNIVDLNFTDTHKWTSDPFLEPIRAAVSTMSLRRLTLGCCEDMAQVLRDQPELEELDIGWNTHGAEKLEKHHIPKLRSLRAPLAEAVLLVSGRPVEQLHLSSGMVDEDLDEQLFGRLSLSGGPITEFSTYFVSSSEAERVRISLQVLTRNLPQLEKLTINVGGSISGQVILDEIPSLQRLRRLTFLNAILATGTENIQKAPIQSEWDNLFAQLKALCPLLVFTKFTPPMYFGCWE